jgi:hypothetical protein
VYAATEGRPAALPADGVPEGLPPRAIDLDSRIAVIVSTVPSHIYNATSLAERMSDLDWVGSAANAHNGVVDELAESGVVVLPFGLFTLFTTEAKALATLRQSLASLSTAFDRIRGREEWVLRISAPDPALIEREPASPATSGTSFLAAKSAARREERERAERVKRDAAAVFEALKPLAAEAKRREIASRGRLLLDASFLVPPAKVEHMRQVLAGAASRLLRDGCRVMFEGPWPAYGFAYVEPHADVQ